MAVTESKPTETQGSNGRGATPPPPENGKKPNGTRTMIIRIVVVIAIIIAVIWGIHFYQYNKTHASTDDAYVGGDLVYAGPIISGTLLTLNNLDVGSVVHKGDVLAKLDDTGPKAAYNQALASYQAAMSQIPQAQTNLAFQQETTAQQIKQAQAALNAQLSRVKQETIRTTLTQRQTSSQVSQAKATAAAAQAQVRTANQNYLAALKAVQTAQANVDSLQHNVDSASAVAAQKHRDAQRYSALYGPNGSVGAVTAQQVDAAVYADQSAQAQLSQARAQVAQARSGVDQARAQADALKAAWDASSQQADASQSGVGVAEAGELNVPVQEGAVANNQDIVSQNEAQLGAAQAGQQQVKLRQQQITTLQAQADQAKSALDAAKVTLDDCVIYAPCDGVISKKNVNVGEALQPGSTIFTIRRGSSVWVDANFKETQLAGMKPGQHADVEVDAVPGVTFRGHLEVINSASGNATALLPTDNATGNFTKVVQRIPVRIVLDDPAPAGNANHYATQEQINEMPLGLSAVATVDLKGS